MDPTASNGLGKDWYYFLGCFKQYLLNKCIKI